MAFLARRILNQGAFVARPLRYHTRRDFAPGLRPHATPRWSQFLNTRQYHRPSHYGYTRFSGPERPASLLQRWAARPSFYYEVGGAGLLVGVFYISNLEQVPVSGRRRFNIVSSETEASYSKEQYRIILQQLGPLVLPPSDPRSRRVRRVLERLIPASGLDAENWEVHVVEGQEPNAFVIPGGKVFVFSGILPICKDDDGLAAVLGHEIAHNVAHHAAERMSAGFVLSGLVLVLGFMFGIPDFGSRMILSLAFDRPNSRKQESEADYIGLMMMAQSCFNPEGAVAFWRRMDRAAEFEPPQILSTHPSSRSRFEQLQGWLPEAQEKQAQSDCGRVLDYADDFRRAFPQLRW
ncbi:hypothetical protein EJ06DRAFT_401824 [Trichodelitschia bisporula]|uniref:Peptidase M48 domain-containing protein n=1 Tax=Trichodelitschia bisporula TaxID=703511 RepID=A0A6G1HXJ9_9PEZI|nr:hypothetical protein EJ06DRAFT_401824 [Trichodelitschia bisporula]